MKFDGVSLKFYFYFLSSSENLVSSHFETEISVQGFTNFEKKGRYIDIVFLKMINSNWMSFQ